MFNITPIVLVNNVRQAINSEFPKIDYSLFGQPGQTLAFEVNNKLIKYSGKLYVTEHSVLTEPMNMDKSVWLSRILLVSTTSKIVDVGLTPLLLNSGTVQLGLEIR